MRLILTILSFICFNANATIYYVSNTGSDAANGTTTGTAWQTIAKVNASSFSPGDQILFKKGDSWNERLVPPSSGSAGNLITFGAYGTGANPILTGFQTLTFSDQGSNIWAATFTNSVRHQNTVYINGAVRAKGRNPNTGYSTISSFSGQSQITTALSGTPNYTGAEVVIWNNSYTIDKSYITSQTSGTLNFSPATTYVLTANKGFFIQNVLSALDIANEWCIDTTTKIISAYATSQPTGKASSIDTLIYLNGVNYITFDGIDLEGANIAAIEIKNSDNVTFTNGNITNSGADAVHGNTSIDHFSFTNNTVTNSWNDAVDLQYNSMPDLGENDYATITGNTIRNCGTVAGMGKSAYDTYEGIVVFGDFANISNNSLVNTGYDVIRFYGDSVLIKNNFIDTFSITKIDCGAINTFNSGTYVSKRGGRVLSNIILNGLGVSGFSFSNALNVHGIYVDGKVSYLFIDSNTVYNCYGYGIFMNNGDTNTVRGNTSINNIYTQISYTNNSLVAADMYVTGNTFYMATNVNATYLASGSGFTPGIANFGTMDSNYYSKPAGESNAIYFSGVLYALSGFQAASGKDTHSYGTPTGITSATPLFQYNATTSPITNVLTGTYISSRWVTYNNSITLQPFTSAILFKATQDIIPPTPANHLSIKRRLRL